MRSLYCFDCCLELAGLTPSVATLVDTPEGVEIFNAVTTKRMLSNPQELESTIGVNDNAENLKMSNATLTQSKKRYMESRVAVQRGDVTDYERLGKVIARNIPPAQVTQFGEDNRVRKFTKYADGSVIEHKGQETDFISPQNPIAKAVKEIQRKTDQMDR